jgi:hypothetical protein
MNIFLKVNKTYLLFLSLLALGLLSACYNPAPTTNIPKEPLSSPDRIDVVYFYDVKVCLCHAVVGAQIQSTLLKNFSKEQTSGKLTFQCVDIDNQNNAAIVSKYGATSLSLFITLVRADTEHIVAVPEISLVKDDEEALDRLVNTRIRGYLDGEE